MPNKFGPIGLTVLLRMALPLQKKDQPSQPTLEYINESSYFNSVIFFIMFSHGCLGKPLAFSAHGALPQERSMVCHVETPPRSKSSTKEICEQRGAHKWKAASSMGLASAYVPWSKHAGNGHPNS